MRASAASTAASKSSPLPACRFSNHSCASSYSTSASGWKVIGRLTGLPSDAPLILRLAKPLDRALLGSMLSVTDAAGQPVAGEVTVGGGERVVTFAPAKPWARGEYKLAVDTRLEDVCGNRVGEPFEVDVFRPIERKIETKTVERKFTVR